MNTYKKLLAASALAMLTGGLMAGGASAKTLVYCSEAAPGGFDPAPVSYTHLTLPTNREV